VTTSSTSDPLTKQNDTETPLSSIKDECNSQHPLPTALLTDELTSTSSKPLVPTLPLDQLNQQLAQEQCLLQDNSQSKEELEVDDQQVEAEEADYNNDEEATEKTPEEARAPAEELEKTKPSTTCWKHTGHSTYVKVDSNLASKDEELNEDAEELIQTINSDKPSYPTAIADIITISQVTKSTAWGAISIKIEDLDLLMRRRQVAHELFHQSAWADYDDTRYTNYLAAIPTNLFQLLDISKISKPLAAIFKEYDFWKLQINGAQNINTLMTVDGPKPTNEKIAEVLHNSPAWLI
jgi:hypothetical protein